jgi:hypothetical protein
MDGLVLSFFDSFFREILFGEIPERRVWVFGSVVVLPWFVAFVVLLADDSLELVLT